MLKLKNPLPKINHLPAHECPIKFAIEKRAFYRVFHSKNRIFAPL